MIPITEPRINAPIKKASWIRGEASGFNRNIAVRTDEHMEMPMHSEIIRLEIKSPPYPTADKNIAIMELNKTV